MVRDVVAHENPSPFILIVLRKIYRCCSSPLPPPSGVRGGGGTYPVGQKRAFYSGWVPVMFLCDMFLPLIVAGGRVHFLRFDRSTDHFLPPPPSSTSLLPRTAVSGRLRYPGGGGERGGVTCLIDTYHPLRLNSFIGSVFPLAEYSYSAKKIPPLLPSLSCVKFIGVALAPPPPPSGFAEGEEHIRLARNVHFTRVGYRYQ